MRNAIISRALLLQAIAYAAFISLGLPDAVNGVAWPSVRETFALPNAALGAITVASTLSYLASSMYTPRLLSRFGVGILLMGSTSLVALGLLGYATAPLWALFVGAALLNGVGSGAIDTSLNAYAAKHFSLRSMNWLHGFYMVGAGLGPAIMTLVLARALPWRVGYGVLAGILVMLALVFLATRRQWDNGDTRLPDEPATAQNATPVQSALRSKVVLLQSSLFFLHTAMEVTTGLWCYTYLVESRGLAPATAGTLTTIYWVVFAAGRFMLGAAAHHIGPTWLVRMGALLAMAGALLFAWAPTSLSGVGLACIGLGLAPIFPTLMSCTPARVGEPLANTAVGAQVSASSIGSALMPALAGLVASRYGLGAIPLIITATGILLLAAHELLLKTTIGVGTRSYATN